LSFAPLRLLVFLFRSVRPRYGKLAANFRRASRECGAGQGERAADRQIWLPFLNRMTSESDTKIKIT
jgi:hypothetical protein